MKSLRIRATLTLRNAKMVAAREAKGWSQTDAAGAAKVPLKVIQSFECLSYRMTNAEERAATVAAALGLNSDDVMPEGPAGRKVESTHRREFDGDTAALLECQSSRLLLPDPSESATAAEIVEAMGRVVETLTAREAEIVRRRFGLRPYGRPATLDETAKALRITKERVRQIEAKAVARLRHPERSKHLSAFVGGQSPEESWVVP